MTDVTRGKDVPRVTAPRACLRYCAVGLRVRGPEVSMERTDPSRLESGLDPADDDGASTWWIGASTDGFVLMWRWLAEHSQRDHPD